MARGRRRARQLGDRPGRAPRGRRHARSATPTPSSARWSGGRSTRASRWPTWSPPRRSWAPTRSASSARAWPCAGARHPAAPARCPSASARPPRRAPRRRPAPGWPIRGRSERAVPPRAADPLSSSVPSTATAAREFYAADSRELAPRLLGKAARARATCRAHRRGRGVLRRRGPRQPRLPGPDAPQRHDVRRARACCTCTSPTACTGAPTSCAARTAGPRRCSSGRSTRSRGSRPCGPAGRRPAPRRDLTNGPAKLCQALGIERSLDGADLVTGDRGIAVVDDGTPPPRRPRPVDPHRPDARAPSTRGAGSFAGDPYVSATRSRRS